MKRLFCIGLLGLAAAGFRTAAGEPDAAMLKRGEYLVDAVCLCADCHTFRDWKGTLDRAHWLQGAKLDFKPTRITPWADHAPGIAGLPGFATDDAAVAFFETGLKAGKKCSTPMPQYRFSHDDARAIVAYLRSLPAAVK
jgi:hypothetical protein